MFHIHATLFFSIFRIGRTGRGNAKGWATTLINKSVDEAVMLDLKHLLIEANQQVSLFADYFTKWTQSTMLFPPKVPPFLATLQSEAEKFMPGMAEDNRGCSYCGGLGHRITNCPKLDAIQHKKAADAGCQLVLDLDQEIFYFLSEEKSKIWIWYYPFPGVAN